MKLFQMSQIDRVEWEIGNHHLFQCLLCYLKSQFWLCTQHGLLLCLTLVRRSFMLSYYNMFMNEGRAENWKFLKTTYFNMGNSLWNAFRLVYRFSFCLCFSSIISFIFHVLFHIFLLLYYYISCKSKYHIWLNFFRCKHKYWVYMPSLFLMYEWKKMKNRIKKNNWNLHILLCDGRFLFNIFYHFVFRFLSQSKIF